jgi:hypothetical protein
MTSPTPDQLWSLANVITGFSVAQNLAFLYALGKDLHILQTLPKTSKYLLSSLIILFSTIYIAANHEIYSMVKTMKDVDATNWGTVDLGRSVAILSFSGLGVVGLFAPELFSWIASVGKPKPADKS